MRDAERVEQAAIAAVADLCGKHVLEVGCGDRHTGHAAAHHAYLVTDHRSSDEPWLLLTGDSLLVGDAGRPGLHAMASTPSRRWRARCIGR